MIYHIKPGGSGKGLSYWERFLDRYCPRREYLNKSFVAKLQLEAMAENKPPPVIFTNDDSNDGTDRGTIFHAFMELYYGKAPGFTAPEHVIFSPQNVGPGANPKAIKEGQILANWWINRFGRKGLGDVVSVEEQIDDTSAEVFTGLIRKFGRTDVSAKLDLVTNIRDGAHAREVGDVFEANGFPLVTPLRPGRLMIDFKSALDGGFADKLEYGWQEIHYPWMYYLKHGIKIEQMLFIQVAVGRKKNPEPTLDVIVHEYPTEEKIEALVDHLRIAMEVEAVMAKRITVNRKACAPKFSSGNWCRHLKAGCEGY